MATPDDQADRGTHNWNHEAGSDASQISSATVSRFRPLTREEQNIQTKWRRATLLFYCAIATVISFLSIATSPPGASTAKHNPAHSAIAESGKPNLIGFDVKH